MNTNQIAAWREYLAGQMQTRCGVEKQKAHKIVTRWLRSLNRDTLAHKLAAPRRFRSQRMAPAKSQTRSAGA